MAAGRCTAASPGTLGTRPSTFMRRRRWTVAPARHDRTMTAVTDKPPIETPSPAPEEVEKSDWRVVLQFFVVPLALVAVLVTVFFGLQVLRAHRPDPRTTLDDLRSKGGFLLPWVGDP